MGRRTLFIINPDAGNRTLERWRRFAAALRSLGLDFDQSVAERRGDALAIASQNADAYEIIGAVGGDGTAFEVINGILSNRSRRCQLTIVPFGTGNDSAHALGIRSEEHALRALTQGEPSSIDLIQVQCRLDRSPLVRHAMLFAAVGISSELLKRTTPRLKRVCGGRLAYLAGLLLVLRSYRSPLMKITCDSQRTQGRFILACASNGAQFGGGINIAPGARLDDNLFNVNLIEAVGRLETLRQIGRLRQGRHIAHPKVSYQTARKLEIESEHPLEVAADGELLGHTPARFDIRPKFLEVLTPRQSPE